MFLTSNSTGRRFRKLDLWLVKLTKSTTRHRSASKLASSCTTGGVIGEGKSGITAKPLYVRIHYFGFRCVIVMCILCNFFAFLCFKITELWPFLCYLFALDARFGSKLGQISDFLRSVTASQNILKCVLDNLICLIWFKSDQLLGENWQLWSPSPTKQPEISYSMVRLVRMY